MTDFKHCARETTFFWFTPLLSLSLSLLCYYPSFSLSLSPKNERATNHNPNSAFPKMAADILAQRWTKSLQFPESFTYFHGESLTQLCGCSRSIRSRPCLSHLWYPSPIPPVLTLFDRGNYGTPSLSYHPRDRSLPFALSPFLPFVPPSFANYSFLLPMRDREHLLLLRDDEVGRQNWDPWVLGFLGWTKHWGHIECSKRILMCEHWCRGVQ